MKGFNLKSWSSKEGFFQSSSNVVSWILASQLLMFLCIPIISRLYEPSVFGIYATFTAIMYIINQVVGLRSEQLVNIPKCDLEAQAIVTTNFIIVLFMTVFIAILTWLFSDFITSSLKLGALKGFLWFFPFCALLAGFRNALLYWAIRKGRFTIVGIANFIQSPALLVIQIGFGLMFPDAKTLIIGAILSWAVPLLFLMLFTINKPFMQALVSNYKNALGVIQENARFLTHASLAILLLTITNYMPVIFISSIYSTKVAAWFALSMQAVYSPLDLISQSIGQVYLNKGAKILHSNPDKLSHFYNDLTKKLFLLALIPICILASLGGPIFKFIFGAAWFEAGQYSQIMSFMLLLRFAILATSQNLVLLKKQGQALLWSLFLLGMMLASFLPGMVLKSPVSPEFTLTVFSINLSIAYAIFYLLNLRAARKHTSHIKNTLHTPSTKPELSLNDGMPKEQIS